MNAENWWYSPLMLDKKENEPGAFFLLLLFLVLFYTTVKALGLQVRSMHGAGPQCAAF